MKIVLLALAIVLFATVAYAACPACAPAQPSVCTPAACSATVTVQATAIVAAPDCYRVHRPLKAVATAPLKLAAVPVRVVAKVAKAVLPPYPRLQARRVCVVKATAPGCCAPAK